MVAWNLLLLGTIVAAGLLTYGWLRTLDLTVAPAAIGGLVFALAPYRLEQSAGHLLGWAALFLPLALLAIERARRAVGRRAHAWGALAALATISIPLSGQVHLALGAIPFIVAYAALRSRKTPLLWTIGGGLVAAGIGLTVRYTLIAGSSEESGRSTEELRRYSAEPLDFLDRWHEPRSEEFVYLGWLTIALAVGGAVLLFRRRRRLAILLGLAAVVPVLFALGANLPGYEPLWRHFPPLHFTRVPGRLLPVANLANRRARGVRVRSPLRACQGTRGGCDRSSRDARCARPARSAAFRSRCRSRQPRLPGACGRRRPDGCSSFPSSGRASTTGASTTTTACKPRGSIRPATPHRAAGGTALLLHLQPPVVRRLAAGRQGMR